MDSYHDVSLLMRRTLRDLGNDNFGRNGAGPRRSLLLDTVMGGHKLKSSGRLLSLPSEILANIVDLLMNDKEALASLALVNSDCRQLARCGQFAEIHFDYSLPANQLIDALSAEAEASAGSQWPPTATIGACVRSVIMASSPANVASRHRELYDSSWGSKSEAYTQEQRRILKQEAMDFYIQLRKSLVTAIVRGMPNLQVLIWKDAVALDKSFFHDISRSPIQHVKLDRVWINEPWCMESPLLPASWPLRSLDLEANVVFGKFMKPDSTTFLHTTLRLCAPTLESLRIVSLIPGRRQQQNASRQNAVALSFPRLKHLRLAFAFLDYGLFSSVFSSPLRNLEFSDTTSPDIGARLAAGQPFRDLESLDVRCLPEDHQEASCIGEFLGKHKHIGKLRVREGDQADRETAHLDSCIIPILSEGGFHNLSCLSLIWGGGSVDTGALPRGVEISTSALSVIGTIETLQQLSLSAGISIGWRYQWLVDHAKLRRYLGKLSRLRMLALVRDTYLVGDSPTSDVHFYYDYRFVGAEERVDAASRPELDNADEGVIYDPDITQLWERAHRNRMLKHAEEYAQVFPALKWILCGQWPIAFEQNSEISTAPRQAIPLTQKRDSCPSFLEGIFGLDTGEGNLPR